MTGQKPQIGDHAGHARLGNLPRLRSGKSLNRLLLRGNANEGDALEEGGSEELGAGSVMTGR
jgi:hypothetical protein